jgi:hypothetical protein
MGTHIHHIIPRHMGGTNDPENLVELTVEEHAEAHQKLYEEHGHWQDHVAWKALSGQINSDEIRRLKTILTWTGRNHTEESKEKIREARKGQHSSGWKWSEESRERKSKSMIGTSQTVESNEKRSKAMLGRAKPTIKCPYCDKEGGVPQMMQWHFNNCKRKI